MNTVLLATTVFASAVAIAALIALFIAFRDERRRSEARVAALRQMVSGVDPAPSEDVLPIDVDDLIASDETLTARPMFSEKSAASPWGRRIAAAGVVASIVAVGGYVLSPRHSPDSDRTARSAGPAAAAAPLELLSLRNAQEKGTLTITGLVQNPRGGAPLNHIVATAFLFGADGTFLASGRAPLDFSTLAPGDESPFVIAIPVKGAVARYRVGFRNEEGHVVGHVDRRSAGTLARTDDERTN